MYDIKIFKSISEINRLEWDSILNKDEIVKSYKFIKAVELSNINNCKFWYLLFYQGNKLVSHGTLFSMKIYLDVLAPTNIKKACLFLRKFYKKFLRVSLVGCGTPVATCTNGIVFTQDADRNSIIDFICNFLNKIALEEKAHCLLFKEYNEKESFYFERLISQGFLKLFSLPTSFIHVEWDSFDEYLRSFRKKYRLLIKNDLKKLKVDFLSIEVHENFDVYCDDMWSLYNNVYENAEVKFEHLTPSFFKNINRELGKNSRVILFREKGKLIAFELIIEDDSILRPMYLGIDYRYNDLYKLYFNSISQIIKHGIESRKKSIELGQTSYYPKLKVGAKIEPLFLYLKFKNFFTHTILYYPMKILFPEVSYSPKNVFNNNNFEKEKI